jgi:hypothetical protein
LSNAELFVVLSKSTAIFCTRGGDFRYLFEGTKR